MLLTFCNTKGGVGKSTLAVHTAVWLFDKGYSVALLDADKQLSSSQWMQEAEPGIAVATANDPDDCLQKAGELLGSYDIVVGDGPGGLDDVSRTLLLLADIAIFPISPSILDLRSVAQATQILKYAQGINRGKPEGRLVLNKLRSRDTISRELQAAAPNLGLQVTEASIRDLQAFRDCVQQGTVVGRLGKKAAEAAKDIEAFCEEISEAINLNERVRGGEVANG